MARKTHCDVCDAVGADDFKVKQVSVPGKPAWDRARLKVTVYANTADGQGYIDEPGAEAGRKDVCDDCRAKLVAEAFGLRTADEVHKLRDELGAFERALKTIALGGIDIEAALAIARQSVGDPTVVVEKDDDIPF
jgi:hypothetical protein